MEEPPLPNVQGDEVVSALTLPEPRRCVDAIGPRRASDQRRYTLGTALPQIMRAVKRDLLQRR